MPSHVLVRMAATGIYLLRGIPREAQQAARVRAAREGTTLRAVLLRALNEYAAGAWPEATMWKCIGLTALATALAVITLGCVRGLVAPTAAVEAETDAAKPVAVRAGVISSEVTVLWRAIGIYRASGPPRMAGPTYEVTSYETKVECEAAQQAAMAREALSRVGPTTEQLADGIKTWDSDRRHYTTFRYFCRLAGAGPAPLVER